MFYKPEPPDFYSLRNPLLKLISEWEAQAKNFFLNAKQDSDPFRKKIYQSSAMVYADCAASATNLITKVSNPE